MIVFYNFINNQAVPYMGQPPYIHWAGPFSTGIYRYKAFYFKCTDTASVPVEILDTGDTNICHIYKGTTPTDGTWQQVEDVLTKSTVLQSVGGGWFQLILVCNAEAPGEYVYDILINGERYQFGCEFHGENEALAINLANKGVELPLSVSKAIYNADMLEEKPDWVLLNRKYRELLINYMDVLGNKGSYKSLFNSLKWFEYDKLVELREIWKYETPDGTKYFDGPIQEALTEELNRQVFNSAKTTYFALRHPLKLVGTNIGETPELVDTAYDWDPMEFTELPQHSIEALTCQWAEEEMRMKMVLLGNFFETYFMPIHSNLLRSVVEDIHVDTSLTMAMGAVDTYINETYSQSENFELDWGSGNISPGGGDGGNWDDNIPNAPNSRLYLYMDEVHALAGVPRNEPYGNAFENTQVTDTIEHYKGLPHIPIVACHEQGEAGVQFDGATWDHFKAAFSQQIFNGVGAIGVGKFKFPEPIISGTCDTNVHGEFIRTDFTEANPSNQFTIKFLFQRPGEYRMIMNFIGVSGKTYGKAVTVRVINNIKLDIDILVLKALVEPGQEVPNPFTAKPDERIEPANRYMFARTKEIDYKVTRVPDGQWLDYQIDYTGVPGYTQYIPVRTIDDGVPNDAPYRTRLYTAIFKGSTCHSQLKQFMAGSDNNGRAFNSSTWCRIGYENPKAPSKSKWCWVQYIYKVRGINGEFPPAGAVEYYTKDVFIPELMRTEVPGKVVESCYPIVCMPTIVLYRRDGEVRKVPYSYYVDEPKTNHTWEFFSWNLQGNINDRLENIDEPFMTWHHNRPIPRGYYTIRFKYDFGDGPKVVEKNTSFRYL